MTIEIKLWNGIWPNMKEFWFERLTSPERLTQQLHKFLTETMIMVNNFDVPRCCNNIFIIYLSLFLQENLLKYYSHRVLSVWGKAKTITRKNDLLFIYISCKINKNKEKNSSNGKNDYDMILQLWLLGLIEYYFSVSAFCFYPLSASSNPKHLPNSQY